MVRAGIYGRGNNMEKRFIGVRELSEYLGIKVNTVYSWVATRKIPYYKVGRLPKFDLREIDGWIRQRKFNPAG